MTAKEKAMQAVNTNAFAADEARLFLDTHPTEEAAMDYYNQKTALYRAAAAEYDKQFGPLFPASGVQNGKWRWGAEPWPWEGGNR